MKSLAIAAIFVSFGAMAACTVEETNDGSGGAGGTDVTSSTSVATTTSSVATTTSVVSSTSTGVIEECSDEADFATCAQCYAEENPAGANAYIEYLYTRCGCDAGATCTAVCDTADAATDLCPEGGVNLGAMITMACDTCMDNLAQGDACVAAFSMDCQGNPDCLEFGTNLQDCP